jgi:hypothetical protein
MVERRFQQESGSILSLIREGMDVYDAANHKIGTVEDLYFGTLDPTSDAADTIAESAPSRRTTGNDSIVHDIAQAFTGDDDMPDVLRNRLMHDGFIRVDGHGLIGTHRYVVPDQIAGVSGDRVLLKVSRDELIRPVT